MRSFTVRVTITSPGPATAATLAPMWTAIGLADDLSPKKRLTVWRLFVTEFYRNAIWGRLFH